jgi:hypothetical protein
MSRIGAGVRNGRHTVAAGLRGAWAVLAVGIAAAPSLGQVVIAERFDSAPSGWSVYGDGTGLTWAATEGNPGGCLRARDEGTGIYWGFVASAAFVGDRGCWYGGSLSWQIKTDSSNGSGPSEPDVRLSGAGLTLVNDLPAPAANAWTTQGVTLLETAGWRKTSLTGAAPTAAEFRSVLGALTEIRFRAEYSTSADTGWIDNVVMTGLPRGCGPDVNCDGSVNVSDFLLFLSLYSAGDARADFNASGSVNLADFLAFLSAFAAGC